MLIKYQANPCTLQTFIHIIRIIQQPENCAAKWQYALYSQLA